MMENAMIRHVIAGTESELSAEENPLEFDRRRKRVDRRHGPVCSTRHVSIQLRIITAHEAGARVANGISAVRFLSQKQLQITIIARTLLPRTPSHFLVAIHRAERASPVQFRLSGQFQVLHLTANCCSAVGHAGERASPALPARYRRGGRLPPWLQLPSLLRRSSTRTLMRSMRISRDEVFV